GDRRQKTAEDDNGDEYGETVAGHGDPHRRVRMAIAASMMARRISAHCVSVGIVSTAATLIAPLTRRRRALATVSAVAGVPDSLVSSVAMGSSVSVMTV